LAQALLAKALYFAQPVRRVRWCALVAAMSAMLLENAKTHNSGLLQSVLVVAMPSLLMVAGSAVAFFGRVPARFQAGTQNFSAGLLIAAVAGELFPLMNGKERPIGADQDDVAQPSEAASTFAIFAGFVIGLVFMFGLEFLTGDEDGEEDNHKAQKESDQGMDKPMLTGVEATEALQAVKDDSRLMAQQVEMLKSRLPMGERDQIDEVVHSMGATVDKTKRHLNLANKEKLIDARNIARMQVHVGELSEQCESLGQCTNLTDARVAYKAVKGTLKHIHGHTERVKFKRWATVAKPPPDVELKETIEWPLVFAVSVDGAVDGLLIGLAFSASKTAGWSMAIATTIEMCFLGLSFSATIENETRSKVKHAGIVCIPPLMLITMGMVGHFIGTLLQEFPLVFVGFIGFAIVALLFLVTQELLAEARETAGSSKLINSMFFVGLFGGIFLAKFIG